MRAHAHIDNVEVESNPKLKFFCPFLFYSFLAIARAKKFLSMPCHLVSVSKFCL